MLSVSVLSEDDSRIATVSPVRRGPVDQDHEAVAEPDQEIDVGREPEPPRQQSGEFQPAEVDDGRATADRGERSLVAVAKIGGRPGSEPRVNRSHDVPPHLLRRGRDAWNRAP